MNRAFVSDATLQDCIRQAEGGLVELDGERFYRIENVDAMPPFFMSLVSDSDHWLFISSNGALTAGRRDPDQALFPYHADDRIHDSVEHTGAKTLLRVQREGRTFLWEPFSQRYEGLYRITRNLYKSTLGNKILFEEINEDLQLVFRQAWMSSDRFGFVRSATLDNRGGGAVDVSLVDGLQNVLPHGLGWRFQLEYSTLGDGYKRTELLPESGLALFRLSSLPVDKAEPSEALRANAAWCTGLPGALCLLSSTQLGAFRKGLPLRGESDVRGLRGAYLVHTTLRLAPDGESTWFIVADLGLDAVGVCALQRHLQRAQDLPAELMADIRRGTANLERLVGGADGLQATADELNTSRHFSSTLFNIMRGGIPGSGYQIEVADARAFLAKSNREVAERWDGMLAELPGELPHAAWIDLISACRDPDFERLGREYLPLTFSRRHGDPSRPWNVFSIQVKHPDGSRIFNYQGNWRDIFQNWEALAFSYPGFLESMIFKFLDASTPDGYNPYRVLREGFEWETIDPHDAWSFIGYWGDHQVIYLLKLLEAADRHHPGALGRLLARRLFTYADVPYRIAPYAELLAHPRRTIRFDPEAHRKAMARAEALGADGKLLADPHGLVRATLLEKLLLVALTKLSNFIPEAGIWMNTQRPEWNDANNALVGYGVSVVTLCHLRRYLAFLRHLLAPLEAESFEVSEELAGLFEAIEKTLEQALPEPGETCPAVARRQTLDALGAAGSAYRARVYAGGFSGTRAALARTRLLAFCQGALRHLDHAIRANRREDGLYHAYNLMQVEGDGIGIRRLTLMLEGQVAVLTSGLLSAGESADLLDALRHSDLYRPDLGSYLLYPDRTLPRFLERNILPESAPARSELIRTLLAAGDGRLVVQDLDGRLHFQAGFRSEADLKQVLEELKAGEYGALARQDEAVVLELYEQVFDHQSFTGRSGTFFKYEGLGCVYWHMVSKLLLAVAEVQERTAGENDRLAFDRLHRHFCEIREGLGVHAPPTVYGAIPTDPYSHTPGFAGAQQPGLTGQVKEDFLARFLELGVQVQEGCLSFQPRMVPRQEFLPHPRIFRFFDVRGEAGTLDLPKDTLAFTVCQVPIVLHRRGGPGLAITREDGTIQWVGQLRLDAAASQGIFGRTGAIRRLDVSLGLPEEE